MEPDRLTVQCTLDTVYYKINFILVNQFLVKRSNLYIVGTFEHKKP